VKRYENFNGRIENLPVSGKIWMTMLDFLRRINKTIDRVSDYTAKGVSYLIFFLMLLVPFEVVMRYVFNRPTIWSMEITQFILCALIAFGGAFTLRTGGHVNVDILYHRFGPRTRAIVNSITYLILFFFLVMLIWKSWGVAVRSLKWGETSSSSFNPPIWPVKFFIPLGAFLLLLQAVAGYIRNIVHAITGSDEFGKKSDPLSAENEE
jgi:TRAP-type mannitol/chloroaromatic compound transport system permease small subunit